jgi:hypothetical protein
LSFMKYSRNSHFCTFTAVEDVDPWILSRDQMA